MRDCEHMKRHLSVVTFRDGKKESEQPVCDPFHTTNVTIGFSLWDVVKMMFGKRETTVRVSVVADNVAYKRWFQGQDTCERCLQTKIGPEPGVHPTEPGYHHGEERWCQACYYEETRDVLPNI